MVGSPLSDWSWLIRLPFHAHVEALVCVGLLYTPQRLMSVQWWKLFHWSPKTHCLFLPQVTLIAQFPLSLCGYAPSQLGLSRFRWVRCVHPPALPFLMHRNEVSYSQLLTSAPNSRSRVLEFTCVFSIGLGFECIERRGPAPFGCGGNNDWMAHHNFVYDSILSAARAAALAPRRDVPSLIPGTRSRPADIFLPNWSGGCSAALDVTDMPHAIAHFGACGHHSWSCPVHCRRKEVGCPWWAVSSGGSEFYSSGFEDFVGLGPGPP